MAHPQLSNGIPSDGHQSSVYPSPASSAYAPSHFSTSPTNSHYTTQTMSLQNPPQQSWQTPAMNHPYNLSMDYSDSSNSHCSTPSPYQMVNPFRYDGTSAPSSTDPSSYATPTSMPVPNADHMFMEQYNYSADPNAYANIANMANMSTTQEQNQPQMQPKNASNKGTGAVVGEKPAYSYVSLIYMAIKSTHEEQATLKEIISFIENRLV